MAIVVQAFTTTWNSVFPTGVGSSRPLRPGRARCVRPGDLAPRPSGPGMNPGPRTCGDSVRRVWDFLSRWRDPPRMIRCFGSLTPRRSISRLRVGRLGMAPGGPAFSGDRKSPFARSARQRAFTSRRLVSPDMESVYPWGSILRGWLWVAVLPPCQSCSPCCSRRLAPGFPGLARVLRQGGKPLCLIDPGLRRPGRGLAATRFARYGRGHSSRPVLLMEFARCGLPLIVDLILPQPM